MQGKINASILCVKSEDKKRIVRSLFWDYRF